MALGLIASTHCRTNNARDSSKNGCNILLYQEEPMGLQKIELFVVTWHFKSNAIDVMGQRKIAMFDATPALDIKHYQHDA